MHVLQESTRQEVSSKMNNMFYEEKLRVYKYVPLR